METLWPKIERLLLGVTKPARYIGGEQGAQTPEHGPGKVAWLLVYPDTYEIGLPNQGLQILYEILNERPDAVAERSYAPWVDMEAAMREAGIPLFSVDQHLRGPGLQRHRLQPVGRARLHQRGQPDRSGRACRCTRRTGGPADPLVMAGGHCAFNPEPLADFVDAFVLGDGEEVVGEINAVHGRLVGPAGRERVIARSCCCRWPAIEGVYCPALYESTYDESGSTGGDVSRWRPACRPRWPSGRCWTWPTGRTRRIRWCR